ncbi:hypothetical protein K474DRAFT_1649687 [Panus rudis PR-1116 ss-1]|nr:hypothetical protein K474DRAFT_1649687 [Panus rudis PR-1116 ss-1]
MKECGTPNVPAFSALRAKQTQLTKELGVWTSHHMSAMGHRFSANAPAETFRLDFANPFVRPHMEFYPEVSSCVSEFWQAGKLLNEDVLDRLQPMWADWTRAKHRHYYVKELARLENNQLVIPLMWYRKDGAIWADAYNVTQEGGVRVRSAMDSSTIVTIRATDLRHNVLDLQAQGLNIQFTQDSPDALKEMPHPLRKIAKGRAMFSVNMMVWSDDVSGNRSKQYNPHTNVYLANLSLPHRKLQQEYFVRFCSTSPHASSSEQMNAVVENIGENNWHETYDCELNEEVMFRIIPRLLPADNPQQSETCSHIGLKGNFFCRRCGVGGKNEVKESNEGYHALFSPGTPRTPQETVAAIEEQLRAACLGVQETVNTLQAQTGVKDKIAQHWISILVPKARELQAQRIRNTHTCDARLRNDHIPAEVKQTIRHELTESIQCELFAWLIQQPPASFNALPPSSPLRNTLRPGDHYNPLLGQRSLNVHRDTPGEILHTYLLGQDKYVWYGTSSTWTDKKDSLFAVRLQSSSTDGLSIPPIRAQYLVQYKNSLIGKHFKVLQQVGVFHLYGPDLCTPLMYQLWKATGELGAMLWMHTIRDMDEYLEDLEILIANVLDIWAEVDPARIIVKAKLHVLAHTPQDVRMFGPAILYSTEVFECWNAIFRLCSVLSNHHAPSQDIARTLADVERFKHQVSGGWWKNEHGVYVTAGEHVRTFMLQNTSLQRRLGWAEPSSRVKGKLSTLPATYPILTWQQAVRDYFPASVSDSIPGPPNSNSEEMWYPCKHLIAHSEDIAKEDSWVFFRHLPPGEQLGRIKRIVTLHRCLGTDGPCIRNGSLAVIKQYEVAGEPDARLNMPVLTAHKDEPFILVNPQVIEQDILFVFNAQHDCEMGSCKPNAHEFVREERQLTERTTVALKHTDFDRYLMNMHALHNADLIRQSLPRHLWKPVPYLKDRAASHAQFAEKVREVRPAKRAEAVTKAAETRARKQAAAAARAQEQGSRSR